MCIRFVLQQWFQETVVTFMIVCLWLEQGLIYHLLVNSSCLLFLSEIFIIKNLAVSKLSGGSVLMHVAKEKDLFLFLLPLPTGKPNFTELQPDGWSSPKAKIKQICSTRKCTKVQISRTHNERFRRKTRTREPRFEDKSQSEVFFCCFVFDIRRWSTDADYCVNRDSLQAEEWYRIPLEGSWLKRAPWHSCAEQLLTVGAITHIQLLQHWLHQGLRSYQSWAFI